MKRKDVCQTVTNNIIQALENGVIPWKKPFKSSFSPIPTNHFTGKAYRGINVFLLNLACIQMSYPNNTWVTYRQVQKLGGHIKKGESSEDILFWKRTILHEKNEELEEETSPKEVYIARIYHVFNIAQCEGLEITEDQQKELPKIQSCESVYDNYPEIKPKLCTGSRAMYIPSTDQISIPNMHDFDSRESYYATLFHELVHSTGHASRLNREGIAQANRSDMIKYSKEELIAEMGASFLSAVTGIDNNDLTDNAAAYIYSWLEVFKQDKKMVVKAASYAQKAVDYLVSFHG